MSKTNAAVKTDDALKVEPTPSVIHGLIQQLIAKVAIVNLSGNVGKSTLGRNLFAPRMGVKMLYSETINSNDGGELISMRDDFEALQDHFLDNDVALLDIGSSTAEAFIRQMKRYEGSHKDIDIYVVPVVPDKKQQRDTIATVDTLVALGVNPKKIVVIFNNIEEGDSVENAFGAILAYAQAEKKCIVDRDLVVLSNPIYEKAKTLNFSVSDLAEKDEEALKDQRRASKDEAEKESLGQAIVATRIARGAKANLDAVYRRFVELVG